MDKAKRSRVRAALDYLPALLSPWYTPATRFVIVTVGRTGSELLSQLLNSHPQIVCDGELQSGLPRFPARYVRAAAARARLAGAEVYGWKLLVGQFRDVHGIRRPECYVTELSEAGYRVILLERRDHLQQSISWYRALATGFHHHRGEEGAFSQYEIDPQLLLSSTAKNEEATEWLRRAVADVPHLTLVYEEDLLDAADHAATVERVCRWLDVAPGPTSTDLVKVAPRSTRDMISNWDEVVLAFRDTRFAHLVAVVDNRPTTIAGDCS
jgi:LPS sulfotransferase NodH